MSHDKLLPSAKLKRTLLIIAVLFCVFAAYALSHLPVKMLSTNIQLTLSPDNLKSLQSAQRSLSSNYLFYTPEQVLDEWLRLESHDTNWHKSLPKCPEQIRLKQQPSDRPLAVNPDPEIWYPATLPSSLHGKGAYEIRSIAVKDASSQCIYDQNGQLFSHEIPEAGSADFYSINANEYLHYLYDVETYLLARALKRSEDYYKVRPPK
jgi:hypothetical protein